MPKLPLIAIVDDDASMREALWDLLHVAGLSGVAFRSAADLLDDDAPNRFDLVITDIRMPHIDGLELIRRMRARGDAPPMLVLTSCADEEVRIKALDAGATAFLTKPVAEDVLLRRIEAALSTDGSAHAPRL